MQRVTVTLAALFIAGCLGTALGWATPINVLPRASLTTTATPTTTPQPVTAASPQALVSARPIPSVSVSPSAPAPMPRTVAPADLPQSTPRATYSPTPRPTPTPPGSCGGCGVHPRFERPGIMCPMMAPAICDNLTPALY